MFAVIFLLFGGTGAPDAQILVTWAYRLGFDQQPRDYAQSAAYGVLMLSILIVFATFYRRWLARTSRRDGVLTMSRHAPRVRTSASPTGDPPSGHRPARRPARAGAALRRSPRAAARHPDRREPDRALPGRCWIVLISLGPDKDDYLHPGRIFDKTRFDNYTYVLSDTDFFDWFGTR